MKKLEITVCSFSKKTLSTSTLRKCKGRFIEPLAVKSFNKTSHNGVASKTFIHFFAHHTMKNRINIDPITLTKAHAKTCMQQYQKNNKKTQIYLNRLGQRKGVSKTQEKVSQREKKNKKHGAVHKVYMSFKLWFLGF